MIVFGTPGSGLAELMRVFEGQIWSVSDAIASLKHSTVSDLVLNNPECLSAAEDRVLQQLNPTQYDLIVLDGSELTRPANQALVRTWGIPLIELTADLSTQAKRLGFNAPHTDALGPVRATLRTMSAERRRRWQGLAASTIDTSHWENAQFVALAAKLVQGKLSNPTT